MKKLKRSLTFYQKVILLECVLLLISFIFQLLANLSVPVSSNIYLSSYQGYKFGVFGLCYQDTCSDQGIGYKSYEIPLLNGYSLPSNARRSISYLLVVHPISACFTFCQFCFCFLSLYKCFSSSSIFLLFLLFWTIPTFLLSLLSFLVDLLLFMPRLSWYGWILLASTTMIAFCGTLTCIMKRTVSSRKLYDSSRQGKIDEIYLNSLSYNDYEEDVGNHESNDYSVATFDSNLDSEQEPLHPQRFVFSRGSSTPISSYIEADSLPHPGLTFVHERREVQVNPVHFMYISDSDSNYVDTDGHSDYQDEDEEEEENYNNRCFNLDDEGGFVTSES